MGKLNPYLNFDGTAEDAFEFYRDVFGGEIIVSHKMSAAPGSENLSHDHRNRMMHIALRMSDGNMLMASDTMPDRDHKPGNNVHLSYHPDSREDADRIFASLSQEGKVEMPIGQQFWGDYFGSVKDKFGVEWMINFHDPNK